MNYSDAVYVFDLDDILYWTSDWYEDVRINIHGYVYHPGRSISLLNAMRLFKKISIQPNIDDRYRSVRLKTQKKFQDDGRDVYFEVVDSSGYPLLVSELEVFLSKQQMIDSCIKENKRFSPFATIADDDKFYLNPSTVAERGSNDLLLEVYNRNYDSAIILTARRNVHGMEKRISELLSDKPPLSIYTQPEDSSDSGTYKGEIIISIASQPSVSRIYFYDDNPSYIQRVENMIRSFDQENQSAIFDKITIINVCSGKKPLNKLKLAYAYGKMFSRDPLLSNVNISNKYLRRLYGE